MSSSWLKDKKIIIIGGTSGIGLSAAKACAAEGALLVVTGKEEADTLHCKELIGDKHQVVTNDAASVNTASSMIQLCMERYGDFDALYHIAGGSGRKFGDGPLHTLSLEGWQKTFDLNLTSMMLSNQAAVKQFLHMGKGGCILNMGSVLGFSPSPGYFSTHAYAAAKSAVIGFSRSIASYYAKDNIRVNVIAPGLTQTPMAARAISDEEILRFVQSKQPLDGGRAGIPEDMDGLAVFLLSDKAKFITGQVIAVDGGWTITEGRYPSA